MDYDEQALIDEVMYLRSLWNFGPPRDPYKSPLAIISADLPPNPNPTHLYKHLPASAHLPNPNAGGLRNHSFRNTNSEIIKNPWQWKRSDIPTSVSDDTPWSCAEAVANTSSEATGWPSIKPSSSSASQTLSDEELSRQAADVAQQNGLKICQGFFKNIADSDNEGRWCSEDDDGDDESNMYAEDDHSSMDETVEFEKSEKFNFFLKLFTDDAQLRGYYEDNFEVGVFSCLVCGATGQKSRKRFKGCVALLNHVVTITKTKNRGAHRDYGQVICKVLGWDIDRLPLIVTSGEQLSRTLGIGEIADNSNGNAIQTEDFSVAAAKKMTSPSIVNTNKLMECNREGELANASNDEPIQTEDSSVDVAKKPACLNGDTGQLSDGLGDVVNCAVPIQTEDSSVDVAKKPGISSINGSSELMECNNEKGELGNGVDTILPEVSSVYVAKKSDSLSNAEVN